MTWAETVCSYTSSEATAYPFWGITLNSPHGEVLLSGVWFNREAAETYLENRRYRFPKKARVFCFSGHESTHIRQLHDVARAEVNP